MPTPAKKSRVPLAAAVSVAILVACIATASSDNSHWVRTLHAGHQSDRFRTAVSTLNSSGSHFDECSVCHARRDWVTTLIEARPPIRSETCAKCHEAKGPVAAGSAAPAPSATPERNRLGVDLIGVRLGRPAHAGQDFPNRVTGMPIPAGGLQCGQCHPDHGGKESMTRVKGDDGSQRLKVTAECVSCHLPKEPSITATTVLKEFLKSHQGGNGFADPKIEDAAAKSIESAPEGQPLSRTTQAAFVAASLKALAGQMSLLGGPDETRRGCSPGCHGEHTAAPDDASAEKYQIKLGSEKK